LEIEGTTLGGCGRARRSPNGPSVPRIGDELATARAERPRSPHSRGDRCRGRGVLVRRGPPALLTRRHRRRASPSTKNADSVRLLRAPCALCATSS
jgi:hypothetical protein